MTAAKKEPGLMEQVIEDGNEAQIRSLMMGMRQQQDPIPTNPEILRVGKVIQAFNQLPTPIQNLLYACMCTFSAKGADYSKEEADRISNFRSAADDAGTTMFQSWYILIHKHWQAVKKFVQKGTLETEPLWKRMQDVIVYVLLLTLVLKEQRPDIEQAPEITAYSPKKDA